MQEDEIDSDLIPVIIGTFGLGVLIGLAVMGCVWWVLG